MSDCPAVTRAGNRSPVCFAALTAVIALVLALAAAAPADAAKRPSERAAKAIERVALTTCNRAAPDPCRMGSARVSTRNPRFAWADVIGEGFSAVLLKRPSARSLRFRVAGTQGGGIGSCAYWRARAPRPVLRDLRVSGVLDVAAGTVGRCG